MKRLLLITTLLFSMVSCTKSAVENPVENTQMLTWEDFPNKDTKTKTIKINANVDDAKLMAQLEKDCEKKKFKIESGKNSGEDVFKNCDENTKIVLDGGTAKNYYAKRTEAKPKNYYPDFFMTIYEFPTETEADSANKEIQKALSSPGFCNGKTPQYVVQYHNKIVYFRTRAELFRDYIVYFAERIEKNYD